LIIEFEKTREIKKKCESLNGILKSDKEVTAKDPAYRRDSLNKYIEKNTLQISQLKGICACIIERVLAKVEKLKKDTERLEKNIAETEMMPYIYSCLNRCAKKIHNLNFTDDVEEYIKNSGSYKESAELIKSSLRRAEKNLMNEMLIQSCIITSSDRTESFMSIYLDIESAFATMMCKDYLAEDE
jgi:hypothetical protein